MVPFGTVNRLHWLLLASLLLSAALYALHRLGLWLEHRGWLYYSRASRKGRTSLAIAAAFDPNARRILDIQEEERAEQDESGDAAPRSAVDHLRRPRRSASTGESDAV